MMTNRSLALLLRSAVARLLIGAKNAGKALGLLPEKRRKYQPAEYGTLRPLNPKVYFMDGNGTIRRFQPKRDKSISGRQWRKRKRAMRELAKKIVDAHQTQAA